MAAAAPPSGTPRPFRNAPFWVPNRACKLWLDAPANSVGSVSWPLRLTSVKLSMVWALIATSWPWITPDRFSTLPAAVIESLPPAWIVPSAFITWPDEAMVRAWLARSLPAFAISPALTTSIWPEISPCGPPGFALP